MQKLIALKVLIVFLLTIALLIPLALIESQIAERKSLQYGVTQSIADSFASSQRILGPLLVVNYVESIKVREKDVATGKEVERTHVTSGQHVILPDALKVVGKAGVSTRYRGIYSAQTFEYDGALEGTFVIPKRFGVGEDTATRTVKITETFLSLGISDVRGIRVAPVLRWNDQDIAFAESTKLGFVDAGINAPLSNLAEGKEYSFQFNLKLAGTDSLSVVPTGKTTAVTLNSSWPHPSFTGRYLPLERNISDRGFDAKWQTSHLATNMPTQIARAAEARAANTGPSGFDSFDVSFFEPVNIYLQAERAVKYGILFVVLTFVAFFLLEILQRLQIHAMQYLFVGLALAIFFLLLISLSEHLAFGWAYLIAAASCTVLQGFYVSYVLRSKLRGATFAAALATLYGFMYMLLRSEDMAFLLGSILMFSALALVMIFTRKVDWYRLPARVTTPAATDLPGVMQ